jgi:hypothetical protein
VGFAPVDQLEGSKEVSAYNEACRGFAEALRVNEEKAASGNVGTQQEVRASASSDISKKPTRLVERRTFLRRPLASHRQSTKSAGTEQQQASDEPEGQAQGEEV